MGLILLWGWSLGQSETSQELALCTGPEELLHDIGADAFGIGLLQDVFATDFNVGFAKGTSALLYRAGKGFAIAAESGGQGSLCACGDGGREDRDKVEDDEGAG